MTTNANSILEAVHIKGVARSSLDFIFNSDKDEVNYLLTVGAPAGLFSAINNYFGYSTFKDESVSQDDATYSGLVPTVFLDSSLSETIAAAYATESLWALAQELYYSQDRSDLSAWVEDGFPFVLNTVSEDELTTLALLHDGTTLTDVNEKTLSFAKL